LKKEGKSKCAPVGQANSTGDIVYDDFESAN